MQRSYVYRSTRKPNRWMYVPDYRPGIRINWRSALTDFLIAAPIGGLMVLVFIKVAETL